MGVFSGVPVIGSYLDAGVEMAGDFIFDVGGDAIGSFLSDTGKYNLFRTKSWRL